MQNALAVISLKRIVQNAEAVSRYVSKPLIAVVKDDAYGHGAEAVALALSDRVGAFAVSTVDEGAALRAAGIDGEILVLTPPLCGEEVLRAASYRLQIAIGSQASLHLVLRAAERYGTPVRGQLAVNTGMNRYGVRPGRAGSLAREAKRGGVEIAGVFSHFYAANDRAAREEQAALFRRAASDVRAVFPACLRHIAATGGALAGDGFDAVRVGIALYGYLPEGFGHALPVKPALKLYATVAQSGTQFGGGAGYARAEERGCKLHTLRIGYGDGLFRAGGVGQIGKLCMDAAVFKGAARPFTRRKVLENVSAYARANGTTEYEALVTLTRKAVKLYV